MPRKSAAQIDISNERFLRLQREKERLLVEQPVTDKNGNRLVPGQIAHYVPIGTREPSRIVEIREVKPRIDTMGHIAGQERVERKPDWDSVDITWFRLRSPEEAEREEHEQNSQLARQSLPLELYVGFSMVETGCIPGTLEIVTDPEEIHKYNLDKAKAELRGCDYKIEVLQSKRIRLARKVRELEEG